MLSKKITITKKVAEKSPVADNKVIKKSLVILKKLDNTSDVLDNIAPKKKISIGKPSIIVNDEDTEDTVSPVKKSIVIKTKDETTEGVGKKISIKKKTIESGDFIHYDHRTHVYRKPDNYICSDEPIKNIEWLYDIKEKKCYEQEFIYFPAWERVYLEILSNASDIANKSRRLGTDPGTIEIKMNKKRIAIKNYGLPFPTGIHKKMGMPTPQAALGVLLTSTNYETERHEAGTNGIGAKATNIFSKYFQVIIYNANEKVKYSQIWRDNMTICEDPITEEYTGAVSSTEILYDIDFERFNIDDKEFYPLDNEGNDPVREAFPDLECENFYNENVMALFARHAIDTSFTLKLAVSFNGIKYDFTNIKKYAILYFGDDAVKNSIVHYQWPTDAVVDIKKGGFQNGSVPPLLEILAIDTPDEARHISFVNCMMTRDGGVHINAAFKALGDSVVNKINDSFKKKGKKSSSDDAANKRSNLININEVKPHISLVMSCRVVNPKFTSQMKTKLSAPVPKIKIEEATLKPLKDWKLVDRLYAAIQAKQFKTLAKNGGRNSRINDLKFKDANAPKNQRLNCILYLVEGDSAASYVQELVRLAPTGREYIGVLPLKGKILNVTNANILQLQNQPELERIRDAIGLIEGLDYGDDNNYSKLRFGSIMVMTDSDVDGKHITGLIINYFHQRFNALLERGFIMYYRTPIVRVTKNRAVRKFFTEGEYLNWKNNTPNHKSWAVKYFKGLGTSKDVDVKDDYNDPHVVNYVYDDNTDDAMKLAFDKKQSDARKDWISNWKPNLELAVTDDQNISDFINDEFIEYSVANVKRSIPKFTDGFKHVNRQIVFGIHKKWNIGSVESKGVKKYKELKVESFANFVAEVADYHHGPTSLSGAIIKMAQDFVGSNNVPLLEQDGQFGTRNEGGKDAPAARYPNTLPSKIFQYIFRKEDQPILKYGTTEEDEKKITEPDTYFPIIPLILVNGSIGIGTGWSTTIANHNLLDVVNWLIHRINLSDTAATSVTTAKNLLPTLIPWYRDFTGKIEVVDRRNKMIRRVRRMQDKMEAEDVHEDPVENDSLEVDPNEKLLDENDEDLEGGEADSDTDSDTEGAATKEEKHQMTEDEIRRSRQLLSMVSYGSYRVEGETIIVNELPIGTWPITYKAWLMGLEKTKKISTFKDYSVKNTVDFRIIGLKEKPNNSILRLKRTMGMSNMVLLDENDKPIRFDTVYDILEKFYNWRLPIYQKRKDYMINKFLEEIEYMENKIKFIKAVIDKIIKVRNVKKAAVYAKMDELEIPHKIYDNTSLTNISIDDIDKLEREITRKQEELDELQNLSIQQIWLNELDELETKYHSIYPNDFGGVRKRTIVIKKKKNEDNEVADNEE